VVDSEAMFVRLLHRFREERIVLQLLHPPANRLPTYNH
jgi:hypothetical protein